MTTMTINDVINGCSFVRRVIGYAKMGVMIHASVRGQAQDRFNQLQEDGVLEAPRIQRVARVLEQMCTGLLPEEGLCREAMAEMDEFLLPMRRTRRASDLMLETASPVRERQRG